MQPIHDLCLEWVLLQASCEETVMVVGCTATKAVLHALRVQAGSLPPVCSASTV